MDAAPPVQIQYAPPPPWHRRRLTRRIIYCVTALIVLAFGFHYWPMIRRTAPQLYWERQCRNYMAPKGTMIYSNDPQDIAKLGSSGGYVTAFKTWSGSFVLAPNQPFEKLASAQGGRSIIPLPAIFLHSRRSPSGAERLVAVQFSKMAGADPFNSLFLIPHTNQTIFDRGSLPIAVTADLQMCLTPSDRVRLYDGQPDPADETHFTIDYDLNGQRGTIDGRLGDDGIVSLTPRIGRFVRYKETGCWSPGGAPMPEWVNRVSPKATTRPAP